MTLILGAALLLILFFGVVAIVIAVLVFGHQDGPREAPTWLGTSAQQVEAAVRAALATGREAPLQAHPAVVELARHHAFDMAVRGFADDQDPEGVNLDGRRRRLHPTFVGHLQQWVCVRPVEAGVDAAGLARALLDGCGDLAPLRSADWNVLGVGVAMERGHLACCLVAGAWWATLDDRIRGELPPSGWTVEGVVEAGTAIDELAVRVLGTDGATRGATAVQEASGRFQLRAVEAPGSGIEVQIVRGEAEGVPRPI